MNGRLSASAVWCFILQALLVVVTVPNAVGSYVSREQMLVKDLGLSSNVTDEEIIKLLDDPRKRIQVVSLIRYRRVSSAVPRLLEILGEEQTSFFSKISMAEALCDFGNKEWIEPIRRLSAELNTPTTLPYRIRMAGLLARAGDYSQFELVKSNIVNDKKHVRSGAIEALGNFRDKADPVTEQAAELLEAVATSDSEPSLRDLAITSLEKIAQARPEMTSKVIKVLQANRNSADKDFWIMCNAKLEAYRQKLMPEEEAIRLLDDRAQFLIAISVIKNRKMTSAAPKLLEMIQRKDTNFSTKFYAAKTLLDLDNRQWIEPMKKLSADPDPSITVKRKIQIAGLLASASDYSQFDLVKSSLSNADQNVHQAAVMALGDFRHKTAEVADRAAELLEAVATTDPNGPVRRLAILSLEKIVEVKPEITPKLISALEANLNSDDKFLCSMCQAKLAKYRQKSNQP
jgi:hypothetical protein